MLLNEKAMAHLPSKVNEVLINSLKETIYINKSVFLSLYKSYQFLLEGIIKTTMNRDPEMVRATK